MRNLAADVESVKKGADVLYRRPAIGPPKREGTVSIFIVRVDPPSLRPSGVNPPKARIEDARVDVAGGQVLEKFVFTHGTPPSRGG